MFRYRLYETGHEYGPTPTQTNSLPTESDTRPAIPSVIADGAWLLPHFASGNSWDWNTNRAVSPSKNRVGVIEGQVEQAMSVLRAEAMGRYARRADPRIVERVFREDCDFSVSPSTGDQASRLRWLALMDTINDAIDVLRTNLLASSANYRGAEEFGQGMRIVYVDNMWLPFIKHDTDLADPTEPLTGAVYGVKGEATVTAGGQVVKKTTGHYSLVNNEATRIQWEGDSQVAWANLGGGSLAVAEPHGQTLTAGQSSLSEAGTSKSATLTFTPATQ